MSSGEIFDSVNMKVDYLGGKSSVAEHGEILLAVNKFELCAQHSLHQTEWWSMVHCMFSLQECMNYETTNASSTDGHSCEEANEGTDDDETMTGLTGLDTADLSDCECSLEGVVDYCATEYTSTTFAELDDCKSSSVGQHLAIASNAIAEAVDSGSALWVNIEDITVSVSNREHSELGIWAKGVKSTVCAHLSYVGVHLEECTEITFF